MKADRAERRAVTWAVLALGLGFSPELARADVSGRDVLRVARQLGPAGRGLLGPSEKLRWIAHVASEAEARRLGLTPITPHLAVARGTAERLEQLARAEPGVGLSWAPPRPFTLDRAHVSTGAAAVQQDYGLTGQGVVVGIIDSGADLTHPAFQHADGSTRVSWLLDFDGEPLGLHPELEEEFGCTDDDSCAVYSAADIDALLSAGQAGPRDRLGHGTHLLSVAAGRDPIYPGVAPEAELIVVRTGSTTGSFADADVLLGARFVFERAAEAGLPAVLNLSAGSSMGSHDGSSDMEQGLAELGQGPGRAVVVSAGNDGELVIGGSGRYPEPFGIFTETDVPVDGEVRVSLLTPESSQAVLTGTAFVWVATSSGDAVSVAFATSKGGRTRAVEPGEAFGFFSDDLGEALPNDYVVSIFNGDNDGQDITIADGATFVVVDGSWQSGRGFDLLLTGHGTARIWLSSTADLGPALTGTGMVLPRAALGGTIGVPASHPELIAVGATVNRLSWVDYEDNSYSQGGVPVGQRAPFSSAGPNRLGNIKPDLLAPGHLVIGALSVAADPRDPDNALSIFANPGCADVGCQVVDDQHVVTSGTSMAAPLVTGAVALLLQREPELTMAQVLRLLRAGAADVPGETGLGSYTGAGTLDIYGALLAQDAEVSGAESWPVAETSRLSLGATFAQARGQAELLGQLLLRDAAGEPAAGFEEARLRLEVEGGSGKMGRISTGLADFSVRARAGSGPGTLWVRAFFDDELLVEAEVPVAVDADLDELGFDAVGGGCALTGRSQGSAGSGLTILGLALLLLGRLRRVATARRATELG